MAEDVVFRISGESAEAVRAWLQTVQAAERFAAKLDDIGHKSRRAKQASDDAFGHETLSQVFSVAAGVGLLTAAIDKGSQAWTNYIRVQNEALKSSREADKGSRKLSQLAESPEDLQGLLTKRDELRELYGIGADEAADAVFAAKSAELTDAELHRGVSGADLGDDPKAATEFMGAVKQIYKGKVDASQAYNVALQASADSPRLNMADVTSNLQEVMAPGNILGIGMEESAALFGEVSAHFSTGSKTADRLKGLLGKLAMNDQFKGQGLAGLEKLAAMDDKTLQREEFLGKDAEKWEALRALRTELPDIKAASERYRQVAAETGTEKDALHKQLEIHRSDPENRRNIELNQQDQKLQIARERNFAELAGQRESAANRERIRIENEGLEIGRRSGATIATETLAGIGFGRDVIPGSSAIGEAVGGMATKGGLVNFAEIFGRFFIREFQSAVASENQKVVDAINKNTEAVTTSKNGVQKIENVNRKLDQPLAPGAGMIQDR